MKRKTIWSPQDRQVAFMERLEDEAFYGGAAGGGKSDSLIIEALRQVDIPYYKGLIIRKTYPELSELIEKSQRYYPAAFPKADYNSSSHTWTFPSKAKIIFGAMQHEKDKLKYQGKAYDFIGFDELTHFTFDEYIYLQSRNRPNGPGTRVYRRSTGNPGGIGHSWVKERFIDAGKPGETIWELANVVFPDGHSEKRWQSRVFIPSSVFDNKILLANDPDYLARLALLPGKVRDALLYGDWNTYTGQYFEDFRIEPDMKAAADAGCEMSEEELKREGRWCHVIEPFDISKGDCRGWKILRSYDFGYGKPFSCAWWAIDFDGTYYRILELYGCTETPNEGLRWTPDQQFKEISRIEQEHPWLKGRKIDGVADPAIWDASRGESIARTADKYGLYFRPGDHKRIPGWMQCHYRLQFDEQGYPRMYVFSNCKAFIRTVPLMMYDDHKGGEDLQTELEDHVCDEWRYAVMDNMISPLRPVKTKTLFFDPLDQYENNLRRKKT